MTRLNFKLMTMCFATLGVLMSSCDEDEVIETKVDSTESSITKYVIGVSASDDATPYILTTESLTEGEITVSGNGLETGVDVTYWAFHEDNYLFGLQYNDGDPVPAESYILDAATGEVVKDLSYTVYRLNSYGTWGEYVLTSSTNDGTEYSTTADDGSIYYSMDFQFGLLNAQNGMSSGITAIAEDFLGNGEYVNLAGYAEVDGWLYTAAIPSGMSNYGVIEYADKIVDQSYVTIGTSGRSSAGIVPYTQYPDHCFMVIYKSTADFPDNPTIVETDKMGFATGRYRSSHRQTFGAADNGDIYVFSPGYGRTYAGATQTLEDESIVELPTVVGQYEAKVMRIKAGEEVFDDSYGPVDLESLLGDRSFLQTYHISEDYFLIKAFTDTNSENDPDKLDAMTYTTNLLFIYKGEEQTANQITGLPDVETISDIGDPFTEDGMMYIPITTDTEGALPTIYCIDPATATATAGLVIDALSIETIGVLSATE